MPRDTGVAVDREVLRRERKLLGDNLVTFAPKARISVQYLSQIERGVRSTVSPKVFAQLCDALGIKDRRKLLAEVDSTDVEAKPEQAAPAGAA